jgi:hypothetical protein
MFSPYEELEFLADHLPGEGEAVLISREDGALVCKPWQNGNLREGVYDPDLYGRLVEANERLNNAGTLPLWVGLGVQVWIVILLHGIFKLGWEHWYMTPATAPLVLFLCYHWIRRRQQETFGLDILPTLRADMLRRHISPHALVCGVRQHVELRTLLDELVRWAPARESVVTRRRREDTLY